MSPIAQVSSGFAPAISVFVLTAGTMAGATGAAWVESGGEQRSGELCTEQEGDCTGATGDRGRQPAVQKDTAADTDWPWRVQAAATDTDWPWRTKADEGENTDWPWAARRVSAASADRPWRVREESARQAADRPWWAGEADPSTDWPW